MKTYQKDLKQLLQLTEEVFEKAKTIDSQMKENEVDQLEEVESLFTKRGQAILRLDQFMKQQMISWTEEDKRSIERLKEIELQLQPILTALHQAFSDQVNRMNQTKQISKKYIGAYQNMATDGSFIDKRN